MRVLACAVLLVAATLVLAQPSTKEDRYGKSVDQVLAMGHQKWFDWYTASERGGMSTAGMSTADEIYAECLGIKTKERLEKVSQTDRTFVTLLDKRLLAVLVGSLSAGRILTGGGTMWNNIGASAEVDRQEVLHDVAFGVKAAPKATQSQFWRAYARAMDELSTNKSDIESYQSAVGGYQEAVDRTWDARNAFALLVPELKTRPVADQRRILAFCTNMMKMITLGD